MSTINTEFAVKFANEFAEYLNDGRDEPRYQCYLHSDADASAQDYVYEQLQKHYGPVVPKEAVTAYRLAFNKHFALKP